MKSFLIILLITIPFFLQAQLDCFPTSEDEPIWGYYSYGGYLEEPEFKIYGLFGDTVIDSIVYSKLYTLSDTVLSETTLKELTAFFRTDGGKVYVRTIWSNSERLFYDFSINLNDTVNLYMANAIVVAMDSVNINGIYHRKLYLDAGLGEGIWIENIGSKYGMLENLRYPTDNNPPVTNLSCFKQNGTNYYPKYNCACFQKYFLKATETEKVLTKGFKVFPNPVNYTSVLQSSSNMPISKIYMYDIKGVMVLSEQIDSVTYLFKNCTLDGGLYFLKVIMQNGNTHTTKIIITI